jgi:hypothetical protein
MALFFGGVPKGLRTPVTTVKETLLRPCVRRCSPNILICVECCPMARTAGRTGVLASRSSRVKLEKPYKPHFVSIILRVSSVSGGAPRAVLFPERGFADDSAFTQSPALL